MPNNIVVKQHHKELSRSIDVDWHRMAETIADRWRQARLRAGLGSRQLDRLIGQTSGYSSPLERGGKKLTTAEIFGIAAKVLNVNADWLITGEGPMERAAPDPPVTQFLLDLRRLPGLEAWLAKTSGEYTVTQVAKVIQIYEESYPSSRESDGRPLGGWEGYFTAALEGKLSMVRPGALDETDAIEQKGMTQEARKRLHRARKKVT